jgi:2-dehydro-3-deoxygalactonokinase
MIGVDWGTTHLRAYRIDASGKPLAARVTPEGILSVSPGAFASTLESVIEDWLELETEGILLSGMISSRQGWLEVPYVACPATPTQIANALKEVTWGNGRRAFICPGLSCRDLDGVPDVMRGEEVQVFGALLDLAPESRFICHPGTHSKHIEVQGHSIVRFMSFMTGELFALLRKHSILARTMVDAGGDWQAFEAGVARANQKCGLLHHLFGARTRVLMGSLSSTSEADYLSGMLIGHEILAAGTWPEIVVGAPELTERYRRAFGIFGCNVRVVAGDTAMAAGLRLIWDLATGRRDTFDDGKVDPG